MHRSTRSISFVLLLLLTARPSSAQGINMRWGECPADGGIRNLAFACNTNTGLRSFTSSFLLPVAVSVVDVDPDLFAAKFGTVDPTADFDCSGGAVDAIDKGIFYFHLSHSCDGFVDAVQRRTWGSVKLHYR